MNSPNRFRPGCEPLDERAMPAIALVGGTLTVAGTGGDDVIRVTLAGGGQVTATILNTGETKTFSLSQVTGIDIGCGLGDDSVAVGQAVTVAAAIRGGAGSDDLNGGGGNDDMKGGLGDDSVSGRIGDDTVRGGGGDDSVGGGKGSDDLFGGDGDDDCRGGDGDDSIDGGSGRDGCDGGDGSDDVVNGFDPDTELLATFTGGQGSAEFKFGPENGGVEREFEVEVEDLAANTAYGVFVDGVSVGTITTDAVGDGRLQFETDFDSDDDGAIEFPAGFPEISVGGVVTVRQGNGTVVRTGTFVVSTDD